MIKEMAYELKINMLLGEKKELEQRLAKKAETIEKLKDVIKYKDLDIEMYIGAISNIKKVVDAKSGLESWQDLQG